LEFGEKMRDMVYRLLPDEPLGRELQRVALECLDEALGRLDGIHDADAIEAEVHETRKRCKETRGLARMVRPALGDGFAPLNAEVRDAARELSGLRDAHALLGAIDDLRDDLSDKKAARLDAVRTRQAAKVAAAGAAVTPDDERITRAAGRLRAARAMVETWDLPDDVDVLAGLERTYTDGRRALKAARKDPGDERVHEWRKRVKDLWYQARLLGADDAAEQLDDLSDLLGDDHDLAVLVDDLADAGDLLDDRTVRRAVRLARDRQSELRSKAFKLGRRVYDGTPDAVVDELTAPWRREPATTMERERKWLVAQMPDLPDDGVRMAQGYLAIDGTVSLRVRDAGAKGCTMTLKGGTGAVRTELEWTIDAERFAAAWNLTGDRRIEKTRYRIPLGEHTAELDVFEGRLAGLVVVEVEFDDEDALAAFEPPGWFGEELTDDGRYTNAALAVDGLPD
jgi:CYTH domain-containing protein/CHAD domain-containing protein